MKNALMVLVALFGLTLVAVDADAARRMGGGTSVGKQRQITPAPKAPAQAPSAAPTAPAQQQQPSGMSKWLGPLAGLALGAGLASLFMGSGLAGALGGILMIALIVAAAVFALRMFRRKHEPEPMQYAGAGAQGVAPKFPTMIGGGAPASSEPVPMQTASRFPAGFDPVQFARHAKINFTQLQAAHDRRDLSTMRDFMTPELYGEIAAQVAKSPTPQHTEVVALDADVLEVVTENGSYVASVRFTGSMREESNAAPESFSEVWHLEKPVSGSSGWLISGIQQG